MVIGIEPERNYIVNGFKIVVDEGGDLPQDYQKKNQIEKMIPMKYTINGIDYTDF